MTHTEGQSEQTVQTSVVAMAVLGTVPEGLVDSVVAACD